MGSSTDFVNLPLELNPEQAIADAFADMAEQFPGWEPADGNPEVWLLRAIAYRFFVPLAELAVDAGAEIFKNFGAQIVNVPALEATAATGETTWTMIDNAGYTIPAGTQVDIPTAGDTSVGFVVSEEVIVPPGSTVTGTGEVIIEAIEPGADGNALDDSPILIDALTFVLTIVLEDPTAGGADAEDGDAYLERLVDTMQTLAPRPIIAHDVEILARNVAGVHRAVALDGYLAGTSDPDDPNDWTEERTVSVAIMGVDGQPCAAPVKTEVDSSLQAKREVNFVFNVIDPTYTTIDVHVAVKVYEGFDQAEVNANVIAAITDYLSPANWGLPVSGNSTDWINRMTVYYQDLVTLVNNQEGVDIYTTLQMRRDADAFAAADIDLDGPAALPEPGSITIV